MASRKDGKLTSQLIQQLGAAISARNMESIAMGYFNMDHEIIANIPRINSEAFNRRVLNHWANKNPKNQIKVRIIL